MVTFSLIGFDDEDHCFLIEQHQTDNDASDILRRRFADFQALGRIIRKAGKQEQGLPMGKLKNLMQGGAWYRDGDGWRREFIGSVQAIES
jgi:hypothetical protein